MIELPETRVLRFREEEIRRMQRPRNAEEGVDWFATQIMREYPGWYIETKVLDESRMYYYVILSKFPVVTFEEQRRRGNYIWVEERIA